MPDFRPNVLHVCQLALQGRHRGIASAAVRKSGGLPAQHATDPLQGQAGAGGGCIERRSRGRIGHRHYGEVHQARQAIRRYPSLRDLDSASS